MSTPSRGSALPKKEPPYGGNAAAKKRLTTSLRAERVAGERALVGKQPVAPGFFASRRELTYIKKREILSDETRERISRRCLGGRQMQFYSSE